MFRVMCHVSWSFVMVFVMLYLNVLGLMLPQSMKVNTVVEYSK